MLKVQALNRLRYIFGDCNWAYKGGNTKCNIKNKSATTILNKKKLKQAFVREQGLGFLVYVHLFISQGNKYLR